MSFTRAKSTGWTAGIDKITSAQMNQIDVNQSRAVDGTGGSNGSPYTPSTTIDIQGQGLQFVVKSGKTVNMESGSVFTNVATQTRSGPLAMSGVGGTTAWRTVDGADANDTYDVTYDEVRAPASVTGTRTWTLRSSTAPTPTVGNRIRFSRNGAALSGDVRLAREGGTILATLQSAGEAWAEFCYMTAPTDATARWRLVAWGGAGILVAAVL